MYVCYCEYKDALCQVWLKLTQWFWRRRWKCEKFMPITGRPRRTMTTDNRQIMIRKAHLSLLLRWAKKLNICIINKSITSYTDYEMMILQIFPFDELKKAVHVQTHKYIGNIISAVLFSSLMVYVILKALKLWNYTSKPLKL